MPSKIVIDTNVWISYFISKRFLEITQLIIDSDCLVFTCEELIDEIIDVISRKKFKNQVTFPIDFYNQLHKKLTTYQKIQIQFTGSPDSKDDFLFDLAIQTNSQILVTGDKKLLAFKNKYVEAISLASFKILKS
jgi:uncharacterized protein